MLCVVAEHLLCERRSTVPLADLVGARFRPPSGRPETHSPQVCSLNFGTRRVAYLVDHVWVWCGSCVRMWWSIGMLCDVVDHAWVYDGSFGMWWIVDHVWECGGSCVSMWWSIGMLCELVDHVWV